MLENFAEKEEIYTSIFLRKHFSLNYHWNQAIFSLIYGIMCSVFSFSGKKESVKFYSTGPEVTRLKFRSHQIKKATLDGSTDPR